MFPFFAARSHFRRMDVVSLCTRRRPFAGILRNRHHGISYAAWYILGRLQPAVQKDTHTGTDAKNNRMYSLLPCPMSIAGQDTIVYHGGMFLVSLFFVLMICIAESFEKNMRKLEHSLLSWIGKNSYIIYLWHYPIIILAQSICWE